MISWNMLHTLLLNIAHQDTQACIGNAGGRVHVTNWLVEDSDTPDALLQPAAGMHALVT